MRLQDAATACAAKCAGRQTQRQECCCCTAYAASAAEAAQTNAQMLALTVRFCSTYHTRHVASGRWHAACVGARQPCCAKRAESAPQLRCMGSQHRPGATLRMCAACCKYVWACEQEDRMDAAPKAAGPKKAGQPASAGSRSRGCAMLTCRVS